VSSSPNLDTWAMNLWVSREFTETGLLLSYKVEILYEQPSKEVKTNDQETTKYDGMYSLGETEKKDVNNIDSICLKTDT
jgi:hypothetical protein